MRHVRVRPDPLVGGNPALLMIRQVECATHGRARGSVAFRPRLSVGMALPWPSYSLWIVRARPKFRIFIRLATIRGDIVKLSIEFPYHGSPAGGVLAGTLGQAKDGHGRAGASARRGAGSAKGAAAALRLSGTRSVINCATLALAPGPGMKKPRGSASDAFSRRGSSFTATVHPLGQPTRWTVPLAGETPIQFLAEFVAGRIQLSR